LIELCDVSKSYRLSAGQSVEALQGASLSIDKPGFYAVMGPSGSGKSTLLHVMAGLDRADSGEIHVNDRAVHALSEAELTRYRRLEIGVIFQQFNLIPTMDAKMNICLPAMLDGQSAQWAEQRAGVLLNDLGLTDRGHHRPDAMSGGEQQRVAIARALLFEPSLILADEPTGNIDSHASEQIWIMLRDLAREHDITVLMVTHEPAAAAYADAVFIIQDGVIDERVEVEEHDARWLANRYQQSLR